MKAGIRRFLKSLILAFQKDRFHSMQRVQLAKNPVSNKVVEVIFMRAFFLLSCPDKLDNTFFFLQMSRKPERLDPNYHGTVDTYYIRGLPNLLTSALKYSNDTQDFFRMITSSHIHCNPFFSCDIKVVVQKMVLRWQWHYISFSGAQGRMHFQPQQEFPYFVIVQPRFYPVFYQAQ